MNYRMEPKSETWKTLIHILAVLLTWGFSFGLQFCASVSQIHNYICFLYNTDVDVYWRRTLNKYWGLSYWDFKVVGPIFNTLWTVNYFGDSHQGSEFNCRNLISSVKGMRRQKKPHLVYTLKVVDPSLLTSFIIYNNWRADSSETQV